MSQTLGLVIFFFLSVVRSGKDKKIDLCAGASLGGLAIGDMGQPRENGLAGKKAAMVVSPLGPRVGRQTFSISGSFSTYIAAVKLRKFCVKNH